MSKNAINYLTENKNKFSKEALINALRKAGYKEDDISKSVKRVYVDFEGENIKNEVTSFWDFKSKKFYRNRTEKIFDFIFGMILPGLVAYVIILIEEDLAWINLFIYIGLLIYFKNKRRYIFKGLLINIIFSVISIVVGIILFFLFGVFRF